ncbi:5,6-dimethylbenzimidazole synthase [Fischerella sp. JS2]|uniref:5,6-dimethylbenzimidazole synthase n=1 Tax=Fischerella sp. JS2 TaxID=2597771 RepID=UPI0028EB3BE6|nr:5,6-dimethylbenzimidazole synthase [Fischerella sp. JS2]
MELEQCLRLRRDTRHFLKDDVPDTVLKKALTAAHCAPSVGLSEPWRFVVVRNQQTKAILKQSFLKIRAKAEADLANDQDKLKLHKSLKLEAIEDAPIGLAVFCEYPKENYTIGTVWTDETLKWSCVCAIQNLWLSLTEQGYSAGWVSILDYDQLKQVLSVPDDWEPLGYLCIGKPATDYDGQPMLEQVGWKQRCSEPVVIYR